MKQNPRNIFCVVLVAIMLLTSVVMLSIGAASATVKDKSTNLQKTSNVPVATTAPVTTKASTTKPTTPQTTKPTETTVKPPKIGTVKNIKKTSSSTNKITLKWTKATNATGYTVYYVNPDKSKKYKKYKSVSKPTVTLKGLRATSPYYFKIVPYTKKDGKTYKGSASVTKTATNTAVVKGLKLLSTSSSVKISWNKNSLATGYTVYRASSLSNGKYIPYKTIKGKSKTSFTDKSVSNGKVYYYRIKAYRTYKALKKTYYSSLSNSVIAVGGLGKINFSVKSELSKALISWKNSSWASGYKVYYSTSSKGKFKKLATVHNTSYRSKLLKVGKKYYFRVIPYKTVGKKTITPQNYVTHSKVINDKIFGRSVSGTYIEVSIKDQHMWFYRNGKLYVDTPVVTGNNDGVHNTPKGIHTIFQRLSPTVLVGDDYRTPVSYWLAFTYSGCGIHDSTWRANWEYGGTTYMGNGSHGCVNTPYNKVAKIYAKARIGTRVIVH